MVNWLGIEDVAAIPTRIWLSREKETEEWQPLRKADCRALTDSRDKPVLIDAGRSTADPEFGVIRSNFFKSPPRSLSSATWFLKDDRDSKNIRLLPLSDLEAIAVEDLYQQAVTAASSLGKGIDPLLQEQVPLPDDHHVALQQQDGHYVMRKCPDRTWFGKSFDLQRGYGAYIVDGEEEEQTLGPVRHLIFVIHGIGEALWSRQDVTFTSSLIQDVISLRLTMQKRQVVEWKIACEVAKKEGQPIPEPPNRVEVVPILWYDRVHSSSNSLMRSLKGTTLNTIPALREIANDVIFDILMYLTPNFCYDVLECVTDQIIEIFEIFKKTHPDFAPNQGVCSLIGHSLGSVIIWDLLSVLQDYSKTGGGSAAEHGVHISHDGYSADVGYTQYASGEDANKAQNGTWGPSLPKPMERYLPFQPDFTLFLGSPLGLFLTLRGAHPVFDEIRDQQKITKSKASPFELPSGSMHNIFHPSDPVAYRIEPLLLSQDTKELPTPLYLTREGQDVRLHVKAMQLGDEIRKSIAEKKHSISSFMTQISEGAQCLLHKRDELNAELEKANNNGAAEEVDARPLRFALAGRKNKSGRLDYQLQPRVIENEYLSAVMAHSSYFVNSDVIDYMVDLTRIKTPEVIDLTNYTDDAVDMDVEPRANINCLS